MYVVTGGAGFIGSHLVEGLNRRGVDRILVVDDLEQGEKFRNLRDLRIADYLDKGDFRRRVEERAFGGELEAVLHQGACTDTTLSDGHYMLENNYGYSKLLLEWAQERGVPFVYASSAAVYGASDDFAEEPENERPLNVYGYSKLLFDQHVRRRLPDADAPVVGLRYFNVYGPNEGHKGAMASMVFQLHEQLRREGEARLFEGSHGYEAGEQRRDFVHVEDVVDVNLFFVERGLEAGEGGIYNLGTGRSRSFNDVAEALIAELGGGEVRYIPFPEELWEKYQAFTEADLTRLRAAGWEGTFTPLEEGVSRLAAALAERGR